MATQDMKEQLELYLQRGYEDKVKEILAKHPSLINEGLNQYDDCSLHIVCIHGHLPLLKFLLSLPVREINKQTKVNQPPPLLLL